MTTTPIRTLMLMLDTIGQRQDAIDRAQKRTDLSHCEWAAASRVWSRQQEALSCAIIAEPPQNVEDMTAVLIELASRHDLIMDQGEDATERELRDLHEMTAVAVKNCVQRMIGLLPADPEPTGVQRHTRVWLAKQIEQWLPAQEDR